MVYGLLMDKRADDIVLPVLFLIAKGVEVAFFQKNGGDLLGQISVFSDFLNISGNANGGNDISVMHDRDVDSFLVPKKESSSETSSVHPVVTAL